MKVKALLRKLVKYGAVSVVSGHVRGSTNTMPLQVEVLYNEYAFVAAFAAAPGDDSFILKMQSQTAERNFESGRRHIVTDE